MFTDTSRFLRIHQLAWVSKRWLQAIYANASFWTEITHGRGRASLMLARSRDLPLTIRCLKHREYQWTDGQLREHEAFETAVLGHVTRWQALELHGDCSIAREIAKMWGSTAAPAEQFSSSLLKRLELSSLEESAPNLEELRQILNNLGSLETLILDHFYDMFSRATTQIIQPTSKHLAPIHLPSLKKLHIELIPPTISDNLLNTIVTPSCGSIFINDLPDEAFDIEGSFLPLVSNALRNYKKIYIAVDFTSYAGPNFTHATIMISSRPAVVDRLTYTQRSDRDFDSDKNLHRFHLQTFSRGPVETLRKMAQFLAATNLSAEVCLAIDRSIGGPRIEPHEWTFPLDLLEELPNLQTIVVNGMEHDVGLIMTHLSTKTLRGDGTYQLPCPDLRRLYCRHFSLWWRSEQDSLIKTLRDYRRELCGDEFLCVFFKDYFAIRSAQCWDEDDSGDEADEDEEEEDEEDEDGDQETDEGEGDSPDSGADETEADEVEESSGGEGEWTSSEEE